MSLLVYCYFFESRRRHTRCSRDWSSDVCSSDLCRVARPKATVSPTFQPAISKNALAPNRPILANVLKGAGTTELEPVASRVRSEERRVGKECRSRWSPYH